VVVADGGDGMVDKSRKGGGEVMRGYGSQEGSVGCTVGHG